MSLNSFFDTLDTETKFTTWKSSTIQRLNHLSDIIPTENIIELRYVNETIASINTLTLLSSNSDTGNKQNIIERLQNCKVGVQMRQTNYGWSVSGTDCMMNGTPMIWQESDCYREIDPDGLFFTKKKDFYEMLDKMLDDDIFRFTQELRSIERAKQLSNNEDKMIKELHKQLNS